MTVKLSVTPAEGEPFEHSFDTDSLTIGRSRSSDLSIEDRYLSRKHARIFRRGSLWLIEDLGSQNGSWLDERRIRQPEPLKRGSILQVSDSFLKIDELPAPASKTLQKMDSIFIDATQILESQGDLSKSDLEGESWKNFDRMRLLNEVHQALAQSLNLDDLLSMILDRIFAHLHPEECAVLIRGEDNEIKPVATRRKYEEHQAFAYSRRLIEEVAEQGMAALVHDINDDERFAGADSLISSGIRSLVAAPLLSGGQSMGMIVLNSRFAVRQFTEEDLDLLVSLASATTLRIKNIRLTDEAAERRQYEEELKLARRIQETLLPSTLPSAQGYDIFAANHPSRGVSGDFYQVIRRNEEESDGGELMLTVADVSGKGMSASLLTASLEALSAAPIEDGLPPEKICAKLSRMVFRRSPPERYATMLMVSLNLRSGRLSYTNAGHNPGFIIRNNGAFDMMNRTGLPIGLLPTGEYHARDLVLEPGDILVLYTDGITEAAGPDSEEFGDRRLIDMVRNNRTEDLNFIAGLLHDALTAFADSASFDDDQTLLMVRRQA